LFLTFLLSFLVGFHLLPIVLSASRPCVISNKREQEDFDRFIASTGSTVEKGNDGEDVIRYSGGCSNTFYAFSIQQKQQQQLGDNTDGIGDDEVGDDSGSEDFDDVDGGLNNKGGDNKGGDNGIVIDGVGDEVWFDAADQLVRFGSVVIIKEDEFFDTEEKRVRFGVSEVRLVPHKDSAEDRASRIFGGSYDNWQTSVWWNCCYQPFEDSLEVVPAVRVRKAFERFQEFLLQLWIVCWFCNRLSLSWVSSHSHPVISVDAIGEEQDLGVIINDLEEEPAATGEDLHPYYLPLLSLSLEKEEEEVQELAATGEVTLLPVTKEKEEEPADTGEDAPTPVTEEEEQQPKPADTGEDERALAATGEDEAKAEPAATGEGEPKPATTGEDELKLAATGENKPELAATGEDEAQAEPAATGEDASSFDIDSFNLDSFDLDSSDLDAPLPVIVNEEEVEFSDLDAPLSAIIEEDDQKVEMDEEDDAELVGFVVHDSACCDGEEELESCIPVSSLPPPVFPVRWSRRLRGMDPLPLNSNGSELRRSRRIGGLPPLAVESLDTVLSRFSRRVL
jgi:hypothetical protein